MLPLKPELNPDEQVLLKTWLWEHVHDKPDGPAHELARQQGVDLLPCLVAAVPLLDIAYASRLIKFLDTEQPQVPAGWPWPAGSDTTRVVRHIGTVIEQNRIHREPDITSEAVAAVLLGLTLTVVGAWAGLGTTVSALAAFFLTIGLFMARKHLKTRWANRRMRFECESGFVAGEESKPDRAQTSQPKAPKYPIQLVLEHRGWSYFICPPGEKETMNCCVCGAVMAVQRHCEGIQSFAAAVFRLTGDHDFFYCKDADATWHQQALSLLQQARRTPSRSIQQLLEKDAQEILHSRISTNSSGATDGPRCELL